jgi:hypothetical protein
VPWSMIVGSDAELRTLLPFDEYQRLAKNFTEASSPHFRLTADMAAHKVELAATAKRWEEEGHKASIPTHKRQVTYAADVEEDMEEDEEDIPSKRVRIVASRAASNEEEEEEGDAEIGDILTALE